MSFNVHKNINRSFFHEQFKNGLVEIYFPVLIKVINSYFNQVSETQEFILAKDEFSKLQLFRQFIKIKVKDFRFEKVKEHIKNLEYSRDLLKSLNENYIKMNSIKDPETIIKSSESDIFTCIFIGVMRKVYTEIYHFRVCDDKIKMDKRKNKIYELIKKSIKKSIERCMPFNFISADRNDIIKIMTNEGKFISMDRQKVLELYDDSKKYKYDNDDAVEKKDEEIIEIEVDRSKDRDKEDNSEDRDKEDNSEDRDKEDDSEDDMDFKRFRRRKVL